MNIIIGTGNFNPNYLLESKKFLTNRMKKSIIKKAIDEGVNIFDTGPDYGNAEKILGNNNSKKVKIITRFNKFNKNKRITSDIIIRNIEKSQKKLKKKTLHAILIHDLSDLIKFKKIYLKTIAIIKMRGMTSKIGISLYNPNDLFKFINFWTPDFIQIPYNVFDRRIEKGNFLNILKEKKIELHVRSIFFKGLLTDKNLMIDKLKTKKKIFSKWFDFCIKHNIEPYKACYLFVKQNKYVKKIILGADSSLQINQIINCKKQFIKIPDFKVKDSFLLNPYKWSGGLREEI
jgi:aryl-alcohol dehydrogenase-like predicted oxidoreductase